MADTYGLSRRADVVADWIEMACLARQTSLGSDALHRLGRAQGYSEADVSLGLGTMARRGSVLGVAYPFRTGGGAAAKPDADRSCWTSLLLMSPGSPARATCDLPEVAAHLERVTAEALTSLYGPGTSSVRFGWPSEDGRPQEFPDAIRWLSSRMRVPLGTAYRPPLGKDGGVDVVAWRPFPDGRSGFPVLLAQCTLERDFVHKAADVDVRVWSGWLALDVDPATALAVPAVVSGQDWSRLAARTTVLDRLRLTSLLRNDEASPERLAPVITWTSEALSHLQEHE